VRLGHIDPQQCTTVGDFAAVLEHFRAAGYRFVSPADVSSGLDPSARHVMVTFDDGYFNNVRALPVMKRCDVPTTFFISTGHVRDGRCFWWDVLYRERSARGASLAQIRAEGAALKRLPYAQIEEELAQHFGSGATKPRGDVDRPLTAAELREVARDPLVHLGNHTRDHAILTRCQRRDVEQQIAGAQEDLREMAGVTPMMIAYPNGDTTVDVVAAARRAGLTLGVTVHPAKNGLPLAVDSDSAMRLGRFTPNGGNRAGISAQCRSFRSDVSLRGYLKRLAQR